MRRCLSLIVVCMALLILPTGLLSQQPPGGKGGGRGGKGGGGPGGRGARGKGRGNNNTTIMGGLFDQMGINVMGGDPTQLFDILSGGRDAIDRTELQQDWQIQMFDRIAQNLQITDGRLTRDQFRMAMEAATGNFAGLAVGMGGDTDQFAEQSFKRYDKNNDGKLDESEMSERLKGVWQQFDANKDGFIDLNEYKEFMKTVMPGGGMNGEMANLMAQFGIQLGQPINPRGMQRPPIDELEDHPIAYRAGKLPAGMPDWFQQLDRDQDGQVGLYEWVGVGRNVEEFKMWDRNGDGFITIDEVVSFMRNMNSSADSRFTLAMGDFGNNNNIGRGRGRGNGPGGRGNPGMGMPGFGNNPGGRNPGGMGGGPGGRGNRDPNGGGGGPGGRGRGRRGGGGGGDDNDN